MWAIAFSSTFTFSGPTVRQRRRSFAAPRAEGCGCGRGALGLAYEVLVAEADALVENVLLQVCVLIAAQRRVGAVLESRASARRGAAARLWALPTC